MSLSELQSTLDEVKAFKRTSMRERLVDLGSIPGSTPRCNRCGALLRLERTQYKRGKWMSGWTCPECGRDHSVQEAHPTYDTGIEL